MKRKHDSNYNEKKIVTDLNYWLCWSGERCGSLYHRIFYVCEEIHHEIWPTTMVWLGRQWNLTGHQYCRQRHSYTFHVPSPSLHFCLSLVRNIQLLFIRRHPMKVWIDFASRNLHARTRPWIARRIPRTEIQFSSDWFRPLSDRLRDAVSIKLFFFVIKENTNSIAWPFSKELNRESIWIFGFRNLPGHDAGAHNYNILKSWVRLMPTKLHIDNVSAVWWKWIRNSMPKPMRMGDGRTRFMPFSEW